MEMFGDEVTGGGEETQLKRNKKQHRVHHQFQIDCVNEEHVICRTMNSINFNEPRLMMINIEPRLIMCKESNDDLLISNQTYSILVG